MSSVGQKKKYDTNDTSDNKVTPISHDISKYNYNTGMWEKYKWEMAPQLIISVVTSKQQDGNLTNSGSNISTSGSHGLQCSE